MKTQSRHFTLKSPCIAISQPMYFPWIGLLQQVYLCDSFVFYDDVQFTRGFFNRVQVKTASGQHWMTVPLLNHHRGQLINQTRIAPLKNWRDKHLSLLKEAYHKAPFRDVILDMVDSVLARNHENLAELSIASTLAIVDYFQLSNNRTFYSSSELYLPGHSTDRLVKIAKQLKAQTYLTGHGARHYLQHMQFEQQGIEVAYMDYSLRSYPQLHEQFTPYITALDLIANCGPEGKQWIHGSVVSWRDFLAGTFTKEDKND